MAMVAWSYPGSTTCHRFSDLGGTSKFPGNICVSCSGLTTLDELLHRLNKSGAQLVGQVVQFGEMYRLCYIAARGIAHRTGGTDRRADGE